MRIADLAKELKITEAFIEKRLKALKLKAKDGGEITAGVEMVLRDTLADEGIGKHVVDEVKPKKVVKKKPAAKTEAKTARKPAAQEKKLDKAPKTEKIIEARKVAPVYNPPPLPKPVAVPKPIPLKPQTVIISKAQPPKPAAPVVPPPVPLPAAKVEPPKVDVSKIVVLAEILLIDPLKKKAPSMNRS